MQSLHKERNPTQRCPEPLCHYKMNTHKEAVVDECPHPHHLSTPCRLNGVRSMGGSSPRCSGQKQSSDLRVRVWRCRTAHIGVARWSSSVLVCKDVNSRARRRAAALPAVHPAKRAAPIELMAIDAHARACAGALMLVVHHAPCRMVIVQLIPGHGAIGEAHATGVRMRARCSAYFRNASIFQNCLNSPRQQIHKVSDSRGAPSLIPRVRGKSNASYVGFPELQFRFYE